MLDRFTKHLHENFNFLHSKKLLIAISGGVDSVVLTHLLHKTGYNISLAHCNFALRGKESDLDEAFVKDLAGSLDIAIHTTRFQTETYCKENGLSIQIGARTLRYQWFQEICKEHGYDYILTAHHLNDSIETFFINLSRGTGIEGLTGIPSQQSNIVRPLLTFTREDIISYAKDHNISWREDASNQETKYLRNKIRHDIISEFKNINPEFEHNFLKTIHFLKDSDDFIQEQIQILKEAYISQEKGQYIIDIEKTAHLSSFKKYHLFKAFGFDQPIEIEKCYHAQTGKMFYSQDFQLLVNRGKLIITGRNKSIDNNIYTIDKTLQTNHLPISLELSDQKGAFAIDPAKLIFPLSVRKKQEGDVFYPLGMVGKKKISKYYKDLKLSAIEKEHTWLLVNGDDKIIAILGYRVDRNFAPKEVSNNNILYIIKK